MNNLERFTKAINWEPTDRILTYDYLDCRQILIDHGGFDATRSYSFEELIEVNGKVHYDPLALSGQGEVHGDESVLAQGHGLPLVVLPFLEAQARQDGLDHPFRLRWVV